MDLATVAKTLGVSEADLQKAVQAARPQPPANGNPPQRGDLDAAEKAHRADHEAREAAMYAAIAKALGKDADAVKKAFEANRPARPATP